MRRTEFCIKEKVAGGFGKSIPSGPPLGEARSVH